MKKIRTYKMTHATGFAPNIDGGILTLATCKEHVREAAKEGDWIAGFTSKELNDDAMGEERLVYLMQVSKKLTYDEYWQKYPEKRPDKSNYFGDNIYTTNPDGYKFVSMTDEAKKQRKEEDKKYKNYEKNYNKYFQIENKNPMGELMPIDLMSEWVLVSTKYKYFGKTNPLDVSKFKGTKKEGVHVPTSQAGYGWISENEKVQEFIDFVMSQKTTPDIDCSTPKSNSKKSSCSS
jgi:hypothetical protein